MKTKPIVVIKVGTNTLTTADATLDQVFIRHLVSQISDLYVSGTINIILVTSGAIACGAQAMGITPKTIAEKQAAAAVGQIILMRDYAQLFLERGIVVAQILLTKDCITDPIRQKNVKNTIATLLSNGVWPIINENDSVATDEIGEKFGDNDELSAGVATLVNATRLILLTDTDGLYTANPKTDPSAVLISQLDSVDSKTFELIQDQPNGRSRGGMTSKLTYAQVASAAGIEVVLANGKREHVIRDIMANHQIGTWVKAQKK